MVDGDGMNPDGPITVTVLDTVTGRTATDSNCCKWWWTDGNGSCDCNREALFDEDTPCDGCLGCHRYLIVAASGGLLSDFNHGYPEELVRRFVPGGGVEPDWYTQQLSYYEAFAPEGEYVVPWRCFDERTPTTPLDPWYFYQDTWAFGRVLEAQPEWLLDVGSTALLVGVLSQVLPVTSVDVRPLPVSLPGLTCQTGDITALPFADGSVPMVSSLSVIEHIGLGRYGDALDPAGSEKACRELVRVLRPGGRLLLSFPTADAAVTLFNAHRMLPVAQVEAWLDGCARVGGIEITGPGMRVWCGEYVKA